MRWSPTCAGWRSSECSWAALYAANTVGDAFKRGSVAMTYLTHPLRTRVTAAQAISLRGRGPRGCRSHRGGGHGHRADRRRRQPRRRRLLGRRRRARGRWALPSPAPSSVPQGRWPAPSPATLPSRRASSWSGALPSPCSREEARREGFGPYLPFQLIGSLTGLSDDVPVLAAMSLLLAYLAVLALAVGRWALPRDLT